MRRIQLIKKELNEYRQLYQTRMNSQQQALITHYFTRWKIENTPPAAAAAAGEEEDPLFESDDEAPDDLGIDFEGFVLKDLAPGIE